MCPGMMPILQASGQMTPGQLGPIRRVLSWRKRCHFTFVMSCWGIPSVIHTTTGEEGRGKVRNGDQNISIRHLFRHGCLGRLTKWDFGLHGFHNGGGSAGRRDVNDGSGGASLAHSLGHRRKNRLA